MIVVMGLDQSQTRTGWAIFKQGADQPIYGHLEYPSWGKDEAIYLDKFFTFLMDTIAEHGVTDVFYEQSFLPVRKKGFKNDTWGSRFPQLALIALILLAAKRSGCNVYVANITDWRRRFIGTHISPPTYGSGTDASTKWFKDQSLGAANRLGWYVFDDNEAEALGIGHYGMCCKDARYTEATNVHTHRQQKLMEEKFRGER